MTKEKRIRDSHIPVAEYMVLQEAITMAIQKNIRTTIIEVILN